MTGDVVIEVTRDWAPEGTARLLELVREGFFADRIYFFRVLPRFLAQFGLSGDPAVCFFVCLTGRSCACSVHLISLLSQTAE